MEKKTWNKSRGGFLSQGQRSGGGKETVPKGRGQWRKERNKGRDQSSRRPPDQDYQRQFKNLSERRDGSGGTPPQRRGGVPDKRPPPRSYYPQNQGASNNLELDLETGTAGGNRGKKCGTSLNYLLNFKYAPREQTVAHRAKFSRRRQPTFNKEQFLQANCQFVVHDSGDYTVYAVDPDILVDWSLIEQVRIYSHGVPSCPICLYPPMAAKITRCGHIYCWTCMLHYQSLSDKSWQKCPICYEAIHKKDLKSVVAMANHQFMAGEEITMRLMKRSKDSVLALPKSQWQERETKPFRINDLIDTHYSKLLLASSEEVLEQVIHIEEKALNEQMQQAKIEQSEEQCFLDLALQELQDRKKRLLGTKQAQVEVEEAMKNAVELQEAHEDGDTNTEEGSCRIYSSGVVEAVGEYEAAFSDAEEDETSKSATRGEETDSLSQSHGDMLDVDGDSRPAGDDHSYASHENRDLSLGIAEGDRADGSLQEGCTSPESHASGSEAGEEYHAADVAIVSPGSSTPNCGYYYFYQADDGQNIFLHPVNARCLVKEYGGLEFCPQLITARVLEMEALSQTEELRRRYRYLGHLPLTCEFVICELDLKPPVISRGTLECFRDVLHQRRQQRLRKMRSEKRREKKLEASNASANGFPTHTGSARRRAESLDLASELEFPTQGSQMAMSPPCSSTSGPSPFLQFAAVNIGHDEGYGTVTEVDNTSASPPTQDTSGGWPPSFAQALRTGKAVESAKVFKKPVKETGVVSAKLAASSGDDDVPVPTFQSAFSEALATSWGEMRAATCNQQQHSDQSRSEVKGKKQKKGKKKQLLFTTGNFMKYT